MEPVRASTSGGLPPALRVLAVALALLWGLFLTPAADAATPADLGVTISKLTLTTPDKSGVVTLSGTVSNRSSGPLYSVRAELWRSTLILRSPAYVEQALTEAESPQGHTVPELPGGSAALTKSDAPLAPGASAAFTVRATLAELDLTSSDTSYWVGVNATAGTKRGAPPNLESKARTLITLPGQTTQTVATVIELSAKPRLVAPGVFSDDDLVGDIAARLDVFADAAAQPGYTYAVDPALIAELTAMADGYQVIANDKTVPGKGAEAAKELLAKIANLPGQGYATRFARANTDVGDATARGDRAASEAGLRSPVIPDAVANGGVQPSKIEPTGALAGQPVSIPAILAARARIAPQVRLVRSTDDLVLDRLATPSWVTRSPLSAVPPNAVGEPTPPRPDASLSARLGALAEAMTTYGAVAPHSGASALVDAQYARGASLWWESEAARSAFLDAVDDRLGSGAFGLGVTLEATPRLSMSSQEAQFPVTLTNHLPDETVVQLVATTDQPQRIRFEQVDPIALRPGTSQTINLRAHASANGVVNARFYLRTVDGHRLTPDSLIVVETTNLGKIGWVIVVVSGVVLVVTTGLRIRQVRARQRENEA